MTTPTDNREAILDRLQALFESALPGVHVYRNRLRIPDEKLPAVSVLDGDETPDDSGYGRGRPANAPIVVTMRPEIYAFTDAPDDKVGPALNVLRKGIIKAILNDVTLLGLCKDREVRYEGFSTGLAQGRSLDGEMAIAFAFTYVLRPASL